MNTKLMLRRFLPLSAVALLIGVLVVRPGIGLLSARAAGSSAMKDSSAAEDSTAEDSTASRGKLELLRVPPSDDYYPCTDCHEPGDPVNRTPRKLTEEHEDIVLDHGGGRLWCLDCHSAENRDFLHTAGGKPIPFSRAHELCGQCHFRRYKDWQNNVHGKRIGHWNGDKKVYVCFKCHNQHSPHFKPLTPKPRPLRPDEIR